MNPFELFKEDWQKLPQSHRYLFEVGFLFIFLTWLKDHWGNWMYHINPFPLNLGYITFYFGLLLIMLGILSLLSKQFSVWRTTFSLKRRYSQNKLGKTYEIIQNQNARGKLYLHDLIKKAKYWIASYQTFRDLDFYSGDIKTIPEKRFNKIPEGPRILTSGTPGS